MNLKRYVKQAVPPEWLERNNSIADMAVGQIKWTVPWAMWVDRDRLCWLHPRYSAHDMSGGTVKMRIQREVDGYHVFIDDSMDRKWELKAHHGYVGGDDCEWIPVAKIHYAR